MLKLILWHDHTEEKRKADVESVSHCIRSVLSHHLGFPSSHFQIWVRLWRIRSAVEHPRFMWCQRKQWASRWLEIQRKECQERWHYGKENLCSSNTMHRPRALFSTHTHTDTQSCSMFHQCSHWGDISSRKVFFPSHTLVSPSSQHRVLCVRPPG